MFSNLPVCGFWNAYYDVMTYWYCTIPIVLFIAGYVCTAIFENKIFSKEAVIIGISYVFFFSLLFCSLMYFPQMGEITKDEYNDYNNKINEVFKRDSIFAKDKVAIIHEWVECSISDGKISEFEKSRFDELYKHYYYEGLMAVNTKKVEKSVIEMKKTLDSYGIKLEK